MRATVCAVLATLLLGAASPGPAQAAIDAPGFFSGPEVNGSGLLWWGRDGLSLSGPSGTHLLVAGSVDARLPEVLVNGGWTVVAEPTMLDAGRARGSLKPIRALRDCRAGTPETWLAALDGGNLYTIVRGGCLTGHPAQAQFLLRVRLATGSLQVIARVPSGAISLVAAGPRLALTYERAAGSPSARLTVDVLDESSARVLYRVSAPSGERTGGGRGGRTQIDVAGNVLVSGSSGPVPSLATFAWWGGPAVGVGRSLQITGEPSLSDGRIAYANYRGNVERIEVLDLRTGRRRTAVEFPGSARLEGVGLGGATLAWAQQSFSYTLPTKAESCVSQTPVGSTELEQVPLSQSRSPILVSGIPVAPATGPICVAPLPR
jgi:hypothetical protein